MFLAIHARYKNVEIGLFKEGFLVDNVSDDNKKVSQNLLIIIKELLEKHTLDIRDLEFLAAHQGPAPFTTLRVCLASINGLGFATKLPLIGVNGLNSLLDEYRKSDQVTIALLNAFCQEVYYAIADPQIPDPIIGFAPAEDFIQKLSRQYTKVYFIGNGALLYKEIINEAFGTRAFIEEVDLVSLEMIGKEAWKRWQEKKVDEQLMPVYLKGYSTR